MAVKKEQFSVCCNLLRENGGLAHNHSGGWAGYKDFKFKAISHLLEDGTIEIRATTFLDPQKLVTAYFVGHVTPDVYGNAAIMLVDKTHGLSDPDLLQYLEEAFVTQIKRLRKPGGRIPKGAIALVMQKKAKHPKQRLTVRRAGSFELNALHDFFVELMIEKDMGINEYTGKIKEKKKKKKVS